MRCPVCKKTTTWQENHFRPFCSERCKLIDLANWLQERYRIAGPEGMSSDAVESDELAQPPALKEELA